MDAVATLVDIFAILAVAYLLVHVDAKDTCSCFDERPIEEVSIVGSYDCRTGLFNMEKEPFNNSLFVRLIENKERSVILWLGSILEVGNILRNYLTICN